MFATFEFQRTAVAVIGALMLTVVSVGAAVGPARAIETTPVYAAAAPASVQANA